jgi:hypothetical protein
MFLRNVKYCHLYVCDYRRGLYWILDLLSTYTHHSELQVITALPLNLHTLQIITP